MSMAQRFLPSSEENVKYVCYIGDDTPLHDRVILENVRYIGVSDISVEIHFKDGTGLRIVNQEQGTPLEVIEIGA